MKTIAIGLKDVQAVYSGPEGKLWELIMGEQIHVGGLSHSQMLAQKAGIKAGWHGIDLCCCLGAGMRFLAKNHDVTMCGVDATETVYKESLKRAKEENLDQKLEFQLGDVTAIPYPNGEFDFVWGEDAWCYVVDKDKLISEAARTLKKGGVIAFSDWIEGPPGLSSEEAERINRFMKFPYMESISGYERLLTKHGFEMKETVDLIEEFAKYVEFYIRMLTEQLTYDALRIIGDDMKLFQAMGAEMTYMLERAREGKWGKAMFIGIKK